MDHKDSTDDPLGNRGPGGVFSYVRWRAASQPAFATALLGEMRLAGYTGALAAPFLNTLSTRRSAEQSPVLFFGVRHQRLFADLAPTDIALIGSVRVAAVGMRRRLPFRVTGAQQLRIRKLYLSDPELSSAFAAKTLEKAEQMLREINPRAFVVANDSLPENRLLIVAARRLSIPSLCIQHGIFQRTSDWRFWDGHFADHMLVWGQAQADAYIERGLPADRVHVMGAPFRDNTAARPAVRDSTLCVFGQPWEVVDPALGERKKAIFEELHALMNQAGIPCVYKPHPNEQDPAYRPSGMAIFSGDMQDALVRFGNFTSLTSTALLEASLQGRRALQIHDPAFDCEDFAEAGYSYAIASSEMHRIPEFLGDDLPAFTVPDTLIHRVSSPARELLRIIGEVGAGSSRGARA